MYYKKQLFCLEYIKDLNADRAREASGLSVSAMQLLNDPEITQEIEHLLHLRAVACKVDANMVVTKLMENAQAAAELKDFAASNAALKLLGEHLGMFAKKTGAPSLTFNFGRSPLPQPATPEPARDITDVTDAEIVEDEDEESL